MEDNDIPEVTMLLEAMVTFVIFGFFMLLPYAALLLFVIRLILFIICEDAFESDDLKKKTIHSAIFAAAAVVVRILFDKMTSNWIIN